MARREMTTPPAEPLSADVAVGAAAGIASASPAAPPPPVAAERALVPREQTLAAREADAVAPARTAASPFISAAEAERRGLLLHIIPELEVVRVSMNDGKVSVDQKLPDGVIVTVTADAVRAEEVMKQRAAAAPETERKATASAQRGDARITVSGPLPDDSLRALAAKVR